MKKRISQYGLTIEFADSGPTIWIIRPSIEEAKEILQLTGEVHAERIWSTIKILDEAQGCNASLREIRSIPEKGKIRISVEFELWEDFLEFKKKMEGEESFQ